jgi:hypothetical protein
MCKEQVHNSVHLLQKIHNNNKNKNNKNNNFFKS